jgi:hypothetical protein
MKVHFVTPTRISLINLTTIGDSEKREDETKIGKFSSGMAFATALLLRDGVDMSISIYGGVEQIEKGEDWFVNEKYTEYINYSTTNRKCVSTNKSKEVIVLEYSKEYHGRCNSQHDFSEPRESEYDEIETAFALQLGYNWELWMSYRELMSNVLDEGGYVLEQETCTELEHGTVITLDFDENSEFFEVWQNRHLYMNFEKPLFKVSNSVECLENKENYLRIYKQNILVYEDKDRPSRFAWNIKFGDIDERRILNNVYSVEQSISYAIQDTDNEEFLRTIITKDFKTEEKEFLSSNCSYSDWISEAVKKITTEIYEEFGEVSSYDWLIDKVRKQKDCKIGGKKIKTIEDSLWSYSNTVTVETKPQTFSTPEIIQTEEEIFEDSFVAEIKKYYNFNLDVEVKKAKLKNSKVVADKYEKCLIIDENFDIQKDFHTFVVEYIDLTRPGNVVENLSKYICELIKK